MSRDRRGDGIQEVDGSIPFGSTNFSFPRHCLSPRAATRMQRVTVRFSIQQRRAASDIHCGSSFDQFVMRWTAFGGACPTRASVTIFPSRMIA